MTTSLRTLVLMVATTAICAAGCSDDPDTNAAAEADLPDETGVDTSSGPDSQQDPALSPPLTLSADLCDDPGNMAVLLDSPAVNEILNSEQLNQEQVELMVDSPTEGPIYQIDLRRYRDTAQYSDGRETDLTGREASDLYDPTELLASAGARVVYQTDVDDQIDGDNIVWETIDIVEYPCPVALFAVLAHPDYQAQAAHMAAAVDNSAAIVADLVPLPPPADPNQTGAAFPPTEDDPAFDLIHVMDFHDIAQYEPDSNEPQRSGREAWSEYQAGGTGASAELGHYPTAVLEVQGVLSGDDRTFDQILMVHMSSKAGFQALLDDSTRQDGRYHRQAALKNNYSMITFPTVSEIPFVQPGSGDLER